LKEDVLRPIYFQVHGRQSAVCLFICQDVLARRLRSDLCGLRVKLPPVTISLTAQM